MIGQETQEPHLQVRLLQEGEKPTGSDTKRSCFRSQLCATKGETRCPASARCCAKQPSENLEPVILGRGRSLLRFVFQ